MKSNFFLLLLTGGLLSSIAARGAETARARLFCLSLQFAQATAFDSYGFQWRMNLTTLSSGINGELAPYFLTTNYTHSAYVEIYSELYDTTDQGAIGLDVPYGGDANNNGFDDFFEVAQGVTNLTSAGVLLSSTFYPSGASFQATWNRAAGSATGTCSFQVDDPDNYFNNLQFTFPFTLLEYTGPLVYTPGSNTVVAAVNLTQHGDNLASSNTLQGPIVFDKSTADPFNMLTNQPGVWTNAAMQALAFTNGLFLHDFTYPTNYYGYVVFNDFDPNTPDPDYIWWELSIDDTNDANANGIPDFSDNPVVARPPRAPQLALLPGMTNLWLTVSGDVGRTNLVQEVDSLAGTNWLTVWTFVTTNQTQTIPLPLPVSGTAFWRVLTQ